MSTEKTTSVSHEHRGPGFATPLEAMRDGQREKFMYVTLISYDGKQPDALATVDIDPQSDTFCQVVHTLHMPYTGDELHHFGWNVCSSCCGNAVKQRRYLIVPGHVSSRIYIIDTIDAKTPKIHKVIPPEVVKFQWNLSAPHTVHCRPDGKIMISMLGDANLDTPGGFLVLDEDFEVLGRWNADEEAKVTNGNHDFWYQIKHDVLVSTEFAPPKNYYFGVKVPDLNLAVSTGAPLFGQHLNFWSYSKKTLTKQFDLGNDSKVLIAARFLHNPNSSHGFVVSVVGGQIWHWWKDQNEWRVEKVAQMEPVEVRHVEGAPPTAFPSDIVISLDDKFMYVSNWLLGDIRQFDITNPSRPRLTGRVQCGQAQTQAKVDAKKREFADLRGGPHMMQLSLDGKRLYVTNSFISTWDDQFYPNLGHKGFHMICLRCDHEQGGLEIDENFLVEFGDVEGHAYRAHEMRYPGGDCTSDIWLA